MHELLVEKLYNNYTMHGFITEEQIFEIIQEHNIRLFEVEYICDQLLSKGVIIRDTEEKDDDAEENYDHSNTDYETIYKNICDIDPSLLGFVEYVQSVMPPQNREWMNLLPQAQNGNIYARNRVFEMYMRVAMKMALSFSIRYGLPLADTIQDGMIGLYTAIDKFEYGKQDMFTTYFPFWVRQSIMREAATRNPTVYFPVHVKDQLFSMYDIEENHSCEICYKQEICPTMISEISQSLNCEYEEALRLYKYLIPFNSIEELLENDENVFSDQGLMWDDFISEMESREFHKIVAQVLVTYTEKENHVICERYGLLNDEPRTLEQVGNKMGVTRERIRQIEAKVIRKLQNDSKIKD